jgi:glycosyltransferase involved in cell wall biosynthesis
VISLHNLNPWCGLDLSRTIAAELAEIAPVAWRMPDMWPLTGCCSYADFCERPAGACPHPAVLAALRAGTSPAGPAAEERARLLAAGRRLVLVSPSAWLAGLARECFADGLRVETIPSGLDLSFWKPVDRAAARRALDLPDAARWVFFIADHADLPLKGGALLREAMTLLPGTRLLTAGRLRRDGSTAWPDGTVHLGSVTDDRLLRLAYAAADVTVVPSLAENLPGVALESIACGTPCAGFAVGGIPDVVLPGHTGALAASITASALADAVSAAAGVSPDALAAARESLDARARALQHHRLLQEMTGA